jgi:hypothetical protein
MKTVFADLIFMSWWLIGFKHICNRINKTVLRIMVPVIFFIRVSGNVLSIFQKLLGRRDGVSYCCEVLRMLISFSGLDNRD